MGPPKLDSAIKQPGYSAQNIATVQDIGILHGTCFGLSLHHLQADELM
jgi:hypothetical protein